MMDDLALGGVPDSEATVDDIGDSGARAIETSGIEELVPEGVLPRLASDGLDEESDTTVDALEYPNPAPGSNCWGTSARRST